MFIQSRAHDETGYVQPTRNDYVKLEDNSIITITEFKHEWVRPDRRLKMSKFLKSFILATIIASPVLAGDKYGIGREATHAEISAWNTDVSPNGDGLPVGSGTVDDGDELCKNIVRIITVFLLKGQGLGLYLQEKMH